MKYLKSIIFITLFLILPRVSNAFTCLAAAGGGNWNAAGTWTSCNSTIPQNGDSVVFDGTSGNVVVNVGSNSLASFVMTGYTGTLSGTNFISVNGVTGTTQNIIFDGTITWTGLLAVGGVTNTSHLNLTTNGKLLTTVSMNAAPLATVTLQDNLSFTAALTNELTLTAGIFDQNGFTISGNSAVNRLLIRSGALGTQKQMLRSGGTYAYVDFRDIDLESAYDCSAITGGCGNALGNSVDFTFTTPVTRYWIGNSGNWSSTAEWSTSSGGGGGATAPLPQDNAIFDANSFSGTGFTVTLDMPRNGTDMTWTGVGADNPTLTQDRAGGNTIYGSVTFSSGMTVTGGGGGYIFQGRGSHTLTSNSVSFARLVTMQMFGGTLTLQDAVSFTPTASSLVITNGTLDTNSSGNYSLTSAGPVTIGAAGTVNLNNSTITLTGTGTTWSANASATINAGGSTIVVSNVTTTAKTFAGGGKTYNNVTITGQNVLWTGSNTGNIMALNTAGFLYGIGNSFTTGTTQTFANFTVNSTSTVDRVMASSTTATNATWAKSGGGTVCLDFINIKDMTGSPASTFYAGANSVDGTDNTNWTFTACPAVGGTPTPTVFFKNSTVNIKDGIFNIKD